MGKNSVQASRHPYLPALFMLEPSELNKPGLLTLLSNWSSTLGAFPILDLNAFFYIFPTADHGLGMRQNGMTGGGHIDMHNDERKDGKSARHVNPGDNYQHKFRKAQIRPRVVPPVEKARYHLDRQ